jgi:hypothetical protein
VQFSSAKLEASLVSSTTRVANTGVLKKGGKAEGVVKMWLPTLVLGHVQTEVIDLTVDSD